MSGVLAILLAAAVSSSTPIVLETELERGTLTVQFRLTDPLPETLEAALPSGATVAVRYQVRVRAIRKVWWDRKMWTGEAVAVATYDPIIGRFRCELVLDGVIVTSHEVETIDEARSWLADPGRVRFAMPEDMGSRPLRVRVRAVFASSTRWLFFPDIEGTAWVEQPIAVPRQQGEPDSDASGG
jgi:hypothetical protein